MTINIRPKTPASGSNNPNRQVSVDVWNEGHALTGAPNSFIGTDGGGNAIELPQANYATTTQLNNYALNTSLNNYTTSALMASAAGSPAVGYQAAGVGAALRTVANKFGEWVSVKDFGAVGDGVADDTAAFTAALATGALNILVPAGVYKTTNKITMSTSKQRLIGLSAGHTELKITSTTVSAVEMANGVTGYGIAGMRISRVGVPGSSAHGVNFLGTCEAAVLFDLDIDGHYDNLRIGTCDTGHIGKLRSRKSLRYGVFQTNSVGYGPSQWDVDDVLCDLNTSDGWRIESTAGPAGLIPGAMRNLRTFANGGRGLHVIGNATTPVFDMRVSDAFLGSDNFGSIRIDSYGGKHRFSGFFERNGRDPVGPTLATPASNNAPGVEISANNVDVTLSNCVIDDNALDGIFHNGGMLVVSGVQSYNNGQASVAGRRNGLLSQGGKVVLSGTVLTNMSGASQLYGIAASHSNISGSGNWFAGNATGPFTFSGGTTNLNLIGNGPGVDNYLSDRITVGGATGTTPTGGINVKDVAKNGTLYTNP